MKYGRRGKNKWDDRTKIFVYEKVKRKGGIEKLEVWKLGTRKSENIKKIGTLENKKLENIRKIGSM